MASSEYYDHTTYPSQGAAGSSSAARAEFEAIETGISAKLPDLSGNGGKIVAINSGATALEAVTTTGSGSAVRATSPTLVTPVIGDANFTSAGAYAVTMTFTGVTGVTFPTSGTLATLAGAESLSNKTLVTPALGVATATSINKTAITAPATSATLALSDGSTLATSGGHSLTLTTTGATNVTLPTSGTLLSSAGAVGTEILAATTAAEGRAALDIGLGNRFINGAMMIDQRNDGAAQTITAGAALAYTVDRWYAYCTGANVTGQRVAGTAPNAYNYQFTGAASVTKIGFAQRIESLNSQDLAGQTATVSIDLANSLLTTVTWTAWYANTSDTFGSLASPTRTLIATGTFTVSSTLSSYSAQISIPSAATTGIEFEVSVGAQTSGTWTIGRVQLELGSVATSFKHRPIGTELALCQRYFYSTAPVPSSALVMDQYGGGAGWQILGTALAHTGPMRATPTLSMPPLSLVNCTTGSVVFGNGVISFSGTVSAAGRCYAQATSTAPITASAEL